MNRAQTTSRAAGEWSAAVPRDHAATLAMFQAAYYVPTGLWALLDVESFQAVTGPKTDVWLVKTVGTLITVVGGVLGLAGMRRRVTPEIELLAVGSALSLATIDVVYTAAGRISPIYLADAAVELGLAAAWAARGGAPVESRAPAPLGVGPEGPGGGA